MPKRQTRTSRRVLLLLAVATVLLFVLGEALLIARSETGQIALAHVPGLGDHNRVTQILSKQLRRAMPALGIPEDSLHVGQTGEGPGRLVWRFGLAPDASLLRANYVVTKMTEQRGARVLSARERLGPDGETVVTMMVGVPGRTTHEVLLVRGRYPQGEEPPHTTRLALVLYGFGDDEKLASDIIALRTPFAVALPPGEKSAAPLIKAAHAQWREIVLHLPLEPIHYPQVNPGPGTLLVTMRPARITELVRRYIAQSRPVVAVANHMGSLATQDATVMTAVYRELRRSGLPFVHVAPVAGAVCHDLAADLGVAYEEPDVIVDAETRDDSPKALEKRWRAIIEDAAGRDRMVIWLRATPLTLRWLEPGFHGIPAGMRMVPLSTVIRRPLVL